MSFLADPVTRATLRQSVSWIRLTPVFPAVMLEASRPSSGRPLRIAAIALCFAAPQAAANFIEAEHDGRLDQMRLAGQTNAAIARSVFGSGSPWLAGGVAALAWALLAGNVSPHALLIVMTLVAVTMAAGAIACTASVFRDEIDPRVSAAGLGIAALTISVMTAGFLVDMPPARYFAAALVLLLVVIAERLRHLPRRLSHPAFGSRNRSAVLRPAASDWLLRWPAYFRGLCLSSTGFVLVAMVGLIEIPMLLFAGPRTRGNLIMLSLVPILIGMVAVSLMCREDVVYGRLDLVRQSSSRSAARSAIELIFGLWTPFLVVLAVVTAVAAPFARPAVDFFFWIPALLILLPLPALEGWSHQWPMLTTIPFLMAMVTVRGPAGYTGVIVAMIGALGWFAAVRTFENPGRPVLPAWASVTAAGVVCVFAIVQYVTLFAPAVTTSAATTLFLLSQVLIDPRNGRLERWGQPLIIFLTLLIGVTLGSGFRLALLAATTAVLAWFGAYRIRQFLPEYPSVQPAIRIAALMIGAEIDSRGLVLDAWLYDLLDFNTPRAMLAAAVAVAVFCEIGYRLSLVRTRSAATLPA